MNVTPDSFYARSKIDANQSINYSIYLKLNQLGFSSDYLNIKDSGILSNCGLDYYDNYIIDYVMRYLICYNALYNILYDALYNILCNMRDMYAIHVVRILYSYICSQNNILDIYSE